MASITSSIAEAVLKVAGGPGKLMVMQRKLAAATVDGVSSGGLVRATFSLNGVCQRVALDPSLLSPDMQQKAEEEVREAVQSGLKQMTVEAPRIMASLAAELK